MREQALRRRRQADARPRDDAERAPQSEIPDRYKQPGRYASDIDLPGSIFDLRRNYKVAFLP